MKKNYVVLFIIVSVSLMALAFGLGVGYSIRYFPFSTTEDMKLWSDFATLIGGIITPVFSLLSLIMVLYVFLIERKDKRKDTELEIAFKYFDQLDRGFNNLFYHHPRTGTNYSDITLLNELYELANKLKNYDLDELIKCNKANNPLKIFLILHEDYKSMKREVGNYLYLHSQAIDFIINNDIIVSPYVFYINYLNIYTVKIIGLFEEDARVSKNLIGVTSLEYSDETEESISISKKIKELEAIYEHI